MPEILAAADIGSNTLHMLVAKYNDRNESQSLVRIENQSEWISLGEIVSKKGMIPPVEVSRLISTLKKYRLLASSLKAEGFYVFATEAIRAATNHKQILEKIFLETGLNVELIDPVRETQLSWRGSLLDSKGKSPTLFVELGGGSVQLAICLGSTITNSISLPLGTGRLIAQSELTYPCKPFQMDILKDIIQRDLQKCLSFGTPARMVASGGVARGLLRALHPDRERMLVLKELEYLSWAAARISIDQMSTRFGVKKKRAMTLVPGALVLLYLMREFIMPKVIVSEYGVREGAILEMMEGKIIPCRL